jgi:hypothetical protein
MTSIALQQSLHSKKQSNNVATLTNRLRISSGRRSSSSSSTSSSTLQIKCEVSISFVRDLKETSVPLVKLTKSRDGTSGTAFFTFENPDIFEGSSGDITGMYLQDEEGEMQTVRFRFRAMFCFYIEDTFFG